MSRKLLGAAAALGFAASLSLSAMAGNTTANGPFDYSKSSLSPVTFAGSGGSAQSAGTFEACAGAAGDDVFPGQGSVNDGPTSANANFGVFAIQQTQDADGNPVSVSISLSSFVGIAIAGAVGFDPSGGTFFPSGTCIPSSVSVANPNLTDYGVYSVTLKAQAPGSGIGVGPGATFQLTLNPPTATDTTPPNVTINSPADGSSQILGVIPVSITANDPDVPVGLGTGVVSISATVSSAGGVVSDQPIALTTDVPKPAGVDAHGTGSFTPTYGAAGGLASSSPTPGLFDVNPAPSGIGRYTLTATATDGAGNMGQAVAGFTVNYAMQFLDQTGHLNTGHPSNSFSQFEFQANRSATTSDGAFMEDQTVVVELQACGGGTPFATHNYGTGGVFGVVQFSATNGHYLTKFQRSDLSGPPISAGSYEAVVYFEDVDGVLFKQATSSCVTF